MRPTFLWEVDTVETIRQIREGSLCNSPRPVQIHRIEAPVVVTFRRVEARNFSLKSTETFVRNLNDD